MNQIDATGYRLPQSPPLGRIVSLVPSQTELLLDLGAEVVGRTRFCIHPQDQVGGIAVVGGTKDFRPDKIRALQPGLILANLEENLAEPLLELRAEIPVWTTQVRNLPEALNMIETVGWLTGKTSEAAALVDAIRAGMPPVAPLPGPRVLYLIWREPWMAVGGDTFIHDLLSRCGCQNSTGEQLRYPSLSDAELRALDPDVILLSSEPYPFKARHLPELQALCPRARIEFVDGSLFSWYGSRLLQTGPYLQKLLNSLEI